MRQLVLSFPSSLAVLSLAACASPPASDAPPPASPMTVSWRLFLDGQAATCDQLGLGDMTLGFQGGTFETCYQDPAQGDETYCLPVNETAPCADGSYSLKPSDATTAYSTSIGAFVPDGPRLYGAGTLHSGSHLDVPFMVAHVDTSWTISGVPDGTYDTIEIHDDDFSETLPYTATGTLHAKALAGTQIQVWISLESSTTGARYDVDQMIAVPQDGTAVTFDVAPTTP